MRHAGVAEQVPVLAVDGRLVAHRQGRQHAGCLCVGHSQQDGVAHRLARTVYRVAHGLSQLAVDGTGGGAHRAAGAQALLEHPQLQVEAAGIERAVRLAQPHRQQPALAGPQLLQRRGQQRVAIEAAVPAERHPSGHAHRPAVALRLLHPKDEARALRPRLRQAGDDAGELQVLPFQFRRQ